MENVNDIIGEEFKRSTASNTQRIFLDITQCLLDSPNFYELPIVERSNMFNELRNVSDFKIKLDDTRAKGPETDQNLPGFSQIQGNEVQNESGH